MDFSFKLFIFEPYIEVYNCVGMSCQREGIWNFLVVLHGVCLVKEFGLGGLLCKFFNSISAGSCLL